MPSHDHNYGEWKRFDLAFVKVQLTGQVHVSPAFRINSFLHISKHVVCGNFMFIIGSTCDVRKVTSTDLVISQAFKITQCNANLNYKSPARECIQIYSALLRKKCKPFLKYFTESQDILK